MNALADVLTWTRPLTPGQTAAVTDALDAARQWDALAEPDKSRFLRQSRSVVRGKQVLLTTFVVMGTADAALWHAFLDARLIFDPVTTPHEQKSYATKHGRFLVADVVEAGGSVGGLDARGYTIIRWPKSINAATGEPVYQRTSEAPRRPEVPAAPYEPDWWERLDVEEAR